LMLVTVRFVGLSGNRAIKKKGMKDNSSYELFIMSSS
jgi:hypothetical protein